MYKLRRGRVDSEILLSRWSAELTINREKKSSVPNGTENQRRSDPGYTRCRLNLRALMDS